jgi:hypothetical protein
MRTLDDSSDEEEKELFADSSDDDEEEEEPVKETDFSFSPENLKRAMVGIILYLYLYVI